MEREVIQSVGFRNIVENGRVTGFQLKVRLPYYRGIFLSQLRPGTLIVDGESFAKETLVWNIKGEDYTYEEMKTDFHTHWNPTETAVIKVKKEGGLKQGFHDITLGYCFTSSYMPPVLQDHLGPDQEAFPFLPEFGHHVNKRRLIIV